ncbi:MAG TPA: DNA-primase RepB domain-containing protein [Chiayiivirga sp.]|nr:DNA-primase RepB domain-containing protein [Chiayiivirga sp.]
MTAPDLDEAAAFLRMLGIRHTFQTFDDAKTGAPLVRTLHGTLDDHAATLADLNTRGAGIFVAVNATDGSRRKTANIRSVRALFVDLDGAPLEPVMAGPLAPHCTVQSSPGRWHAYWRVSDCPLADFKPLQKALAARFNGDAKVHDLPRVMRLPGFDHRKGEPCRARLLELRDAAPYTVAQVRAAFGFDAVSATVVTLPTRKAVERAAKSVAPRQRRTLPQTILEGERNDTLFSCARGLIQRGHDGAAVNERLQRINAERCQPPLCAREVDAIAANASRYGSDGFVALPHHLLDSPEWKAQPPAVHDVVLLAFRRWDGSETGFALTWEDVAGRAGFSSRDTFFRARAAAIDAGFIVRTAAMRVTQSGRKPDLFTVAERWRHGFAKTENQSLRKDRKSDSYIDKQCMANQGVKGTMTAKREPKPHPPKGEAA